MKWMVVLSVVVLLVACSPSGGDQSVEGQLRGNQALLMVLQNAADLDHLYFYYSEADDPYKDANPFDIDTPYTLPGDPTACAKDGDLAACDPSWTQIGELNLMMQNVGGAATAGALYVSGYDPNLIRVESRLGQNPINSVGRSNCYNSIKILNTGKYSVTRVCDEVDSFGYGIDLQGDGSGITGGTGSVGMDSVYAAADWIASRVKGRDVDFFSKYGIFDDAIVTAGEIDGKFGWSITFDSTSYSPNRASYGRLLINLMYGQLAQCTNNCRIFPPRAPTQIMSGIDAEHPIGDALYYDYDIFLNRKAWNSRINDMKQTFQVTACYFYTTSATPSVCVDPDPTVSRNEPCTLAPIVFKESQGAPIKVSRIESRAQPGSIAYTIYLEHIGTGEVWLPSAFEQCGPYLPGRPDPRVRDAVQVLDVRMSGDLRQMRCVPDGSDNIVRLQNGKGQITCIYTVDSRATGGSRQAYTSALSIEIGYVYQNIIQKNVLIHRT